MYFYRITFDQIWQATRSLVDQYLDQNEIKFSSKPTIIIGIHRGGAVPAGMASYLMGNAGGVSGISYSSKTGKGDDKNHDMRPNVEHFANQQILLIDDVCDSGYTLAELTEMLKEQNCTVYTAVVHYKRNVARHNSGFEPDFWWETVENDEECWIVYPWELDDQ